MSSPHKNNTVWTLGSPEPAGDYWQAIQGLLRTELYRNFCVGETFPMNLYPKTETQELNYRNTCTTRCPRICTSYAFRWSLSNGWKPVPSHSTVISHLSDNACRLNKHWECIFLCNRPEESPIFRWKTEYVEFQMPYSHFRDGHTWREMKHRIWCGVTWKEGWKKIYKAFIHAL